MSERLWVKPLAMSLFSILTAFAAKFADGTGLREIVPVIAEESVETLLSVMAASMLVIADDVSQNALSTFIGAFIFGIVALIAVKNEFFGTAGRFTVFVLTILVFALVILMFVRWVDSIARLGRLGTTIDKVEAAAAAALKRQRDAPAMGAVPAGSQRPSGEAVFTATVGYVQRVDIAKLQMWAEKAQGRVVISGLPGTFVAPGRALAYVSAGQRSVGDCKPVEDSFVIGGARLFDDDPRFGLVVLAEIAGRALSPAVNDPGTAIDVVGTLVRLFALWSKPPEEGDAQPKYDRVEAPEIAVQDMFDDAFTAIARDGAGSVEVAVRLQKALQSLASIGNMAMRDAALRHSRLALARAEKTLELDEDLAVVRAAATFSEPYAV